MTALSPDVKIDVLAFVLLAINVHIRAGEFTKKNMYHGKNRVFGPKNAPQKFGSPTPNFPPPQFGLLY